MPTRCLRKCLSEWVVTFGLGQSNRFSNWGLCQLGNKAVGVGFYRREFGDTMGNSAKVGGGLEEERGCPDACLVRRGQDGNKLTSSKGKGYNFFAEIRVATLLVYMLKILAYVRPPGIGYWRRGPKKTKIGHSLWCEVCKIACNSKDVLDRHKLGKKHKMNLEKLEESKKDANASASAAAPVALNLVIGPKEKLTDKENASSVEQTRKKVATPLVPVEDLETKRRKLMEGGAAANAVRVCTICNVACNSQTVFNFHLFGQKHAAMVEKQAAGIPTA
ncbi:hypothetical protein HHK36_024257 [Tetracentron sinense]|uniref:U1-type domain-containing protein n=1 Tax=Tetracentron sinense TaxID=13715 RepID=A0A834YNI4_TETSI|nr:hypothetical protein HHK36_024257 [Tetracentron sinense]